jgi:hypothetical protein
MPFGGVKQSGAGLPENSESGLEAFVNRKAVYLRGGRRTLGPPGRRGALKPPLYVNPRRPPYGLVMLTVVPLLSPSGSWLSADL